MAGIYIHIPFCKQKCSYCDFHFSTTFSAYRDQLIAALIEEIKSRANYLGKQTIETIYFGGGTPSLLTEAELKAIVDSIYKHYTVSPQIEFTLEANPDDINEDQLLMWKARGVNRLSLGVQSFFQSDLDWMNRAHSAKESVESMKLAKKHGFFLTTDLIYGLPNHTLDMLSQNIEQMVSLKPDHISAYCLTVEKGTALHKMIENHYLPVVGEDEQAEAFELLVDILGKRGYQQYEISNFSKNNAYSKHNTNYWLGEHYLGIGPSAHSFNGVSRRWNVANNHQYMKKVSANETYFTEEILSPKDSFNELLLTRLRTKWGVNLEDLLSIHQPDASFYKQKENFLSQGLLVENKGVMSLTKKGKLQADYVASMLFSL